MRRGRTVIAIARARLALFAGVAATAVLGVMSYSVIAPDHYRATATVFFEPGTMEYGTADGRLAAVRGKDLDLLRSERVALRVVDNERLIREPALRAVYLQSIESRRQPQDALAQYLAAHVDTSMRGESGDGGLVNVAVTLDDPALAARVANAYAQAWGEVSLELHAESIRAGIERASQELTGLRARLGEARARGHGDAQLAEMDPRTQAEFAQLSRLATRPLAPGAAAPGSIVDAGDATHGGSTVLPLAPSIDAPAPRAVEAPAAANLSPNLPRAASSAQDEIRMAQQSLERAEERLARLSVEGIGAPFPAHLLRAAVVPEISTKPSIASSLGIGVAGGTLLGLLAVLAAELIDRRVRRPSDLARATGLVVLGSLPAAPPSGKAARAGMLPGWRAGQPA